jgi:hypothetical protein
MVIKGKSPGWPGLFSLLLLLNYIWVVGVIFTSDVIGVEWVRWFLDLTSFFWAVFEENSCKWLMISGFTESEDIPKAEVLLVGPLKKGQA